MENQTRMHGVYLCHRPMRFVFEKWRAGIIVERDQAEEELGDRECSIMSERVFGPFDERKKLLCLRNEERESRNQAEEEWRHGKDCAMEDETTMR